jgi:hypothetical protein
MQRPCARLDRTGTDKLRLPATVRPRYLLRDPDPASALPADPADRVVFRCRQARTSYDAAEEPIMALIDNIAVEIDDFHRSRIEIIDNFDYSKVKAKVANDLGGVTEAYIQDGIENLKLYYVVALLDPLNAHAVSRAVDPFWHAHVLCTREYGRFCREVYDQYVHHEPLDEDNQDEVAKVAELYAYTRDQYGKIFKTTSSEWWGSQTPFAARPI